MSRHFLVIGAQRCGTTWLHDVLAAHPEIAMARPARPEPKAFLGSGALDLEAYRSRFFSHATDEHALGEKSTSYLESPEVPARLAATLGRPHIVVQLRDPVQRAVSNWSFSRDHGLESRPLNEAVRADLDQPRAWNRATSVSPFAYVSRGHYVQDLVRWTEHFEVYVQFLPEVRRSPDRWGPLYRWLGVDETFRPNLAGVRTHASTVAAENLDPELIDTLRDHYFESDTALAALLGRELPWPVRQTA
ncbi:MAG: sulfotransferase domain-containing protein [Ornithinimicrobium sp.]